MRNIQDFNSIKIKIASPELIESWSYGEVKKAETVNYRTLRPDRDGLFCEKIFGTTKDWECFCGKFKSTRYKGVICERCGVEVTSRKVRRKRMGHIKLATPVSHPWFYRSTPSRIAILLAISKNDLKSVIYYENYIVISPGETDLKKCQILTGDQYYDKLETYGEGSFRAEMGSEAIRELLQEINLDELSKSLREEIVRSQRESKGDSTKRQLVLNRLKIVEDLRNGGNRPEWMVLTVLPVIPPDLRPMVQLEGGRFASSDLNDLYRKVINRNNRLLKLLDEHSPDVIVHHEKRLLQECIDALLDSAPVKRTVKSTAKKSISEMLKGKTGRFRQNLLGKRVDFSGRSVIVIGPELRIHQCGLPQLMAMELFKPFLMKKLQANDMGLGEKVARTMVEERDPKVWDLLESVVREHPVILNRAPTLHRLSIQAFEPVLVDGKAIKLHPLVCHGYNADFDGDQMSIHVPLTAAAQIECWTIMLSARNLLDPASGKPIVYPSQDMVLGINYLTKALPDYEAEKHGKDAAYVPQYRYYDNVAEIFNAVDNHAVGYNENILFRVEETGDRVVTTPGRVIFNDFLPVGIPFQNKCFGDKELKNLIAETLKTKTNSLTVKLLDCIKDCGFKYATLFGATISISDMLIPPQKNDIIEESGKKENEFVAQYRTGKISREERYNNVIKLWTGTTEKITGILMDNLRQDRDGFNPLFMMADSGARGSKKQISQLIGMRGNLSKSSGEIIEFPIKSNFKEGQSIMEFFISMNGARKGLADTALKTSRAGHLTRRLVDVSQDVVITQNDCGTINGVVKTAVKDGDKVIESLASRIKGLYALEDVKNPITGEIMVGHNEEITDELANEIEEMGIESVLVRSVLTCESKHGLCQKCYGRNLANYRPVDIGEAVGVVAAQSIGQPGTQLTMRTFHSGGAANASSEEDKISFKHDSIITHMQGDTIKIFSEEDNRDVILFSRKGYIFYHKIQQVVDSGTYLVKEGSRVIKGMPLTKDVTSASVGFAHFIGKKLYVIAEEQSYEVKPGSKVFVDFKGETILKEGEPLLKYNQFEEPIVCEVNGIIEYKDIDAGTTLLEKVLEESGGKVVRIISDKVYQEMEPSLLVKNKKGEILKSYLLPGGSQLVVDDGQTVKAGDTIAKITKEGMKTNDITGGLPRIEELVEARRPSDPAVLAMVDGVVKFEGIERKERVIVVTDIFGKQYKHLIPLSKHILVRDGDTVKAAEPLCDGNIDPHDILEILGENALQEFLVKEIRDVYRAQDVDINEKHCGIVVRQMLRKVRIIKIGDTNFVQNQFVDKQEFVRENLRVENEGGVPAVATPLLQGITKSALSNNSFIAAASFQETTKVLTNSSIAGSMDRLVGLKENVVIGHTIPAGTGMRCYLQGVEIADDMNTADLDERIKSMKDEMLDESGMNESEMSYEDDEAFASAGFTIKEGEDLDSDDDDES